MPASLLLALAPLLLAAADRGGPTTPVVVELFTSEGCSSCPPADAALAELSRTQSVSGTEVIPLELHVDYWNQLGWADPFSDPAFTQRQEAYAHRFGAGDVYTPQLVVDGTTSAVASASALRRAVERAAGSAKAALGVIVASATPGLEVTVQVPDGMAGRLLVALTESDLTSKVERGENRGRILSHAPVARLLVDDGTAAGTHHLRLGVGRAWRRERLRVVALVQDAAGRVIAVGTAPVPAARS
jgi:hypothetical protein